MAEGEGHFDLIISFLESLYVPRVDTGFDKSLNRKDFSDYLVSIDSKLDESRSLVKNELLKGKDYLQRLKKNLLSAAVIIRGQHSSPNLWTTDLSIQYAENIEYEALRLYGHSSLDFALSEDRCALVKEILRKMRPWLLKDTWKLYPAAVTCYLWLVRKMDRNAVHESIGLLLPTALIIVDDHEIENRVKGLECLNHIINKMCYLQLSSNGYDLVIYHAIRSYFTIKEPELIVALGNTFVSLMNKKYPIKGEPDLEMHDFDRVIDIWLSRMYLEEKINIREAYLEIMPLFLKARGLGVIHHSSAIINILKDYCVERTSSYESLLVMEVFIELSWPRAEVLCNEFLFILGQVITNCVVGYLPQECLDKALDNIFYLLEMCPEQVKPFLKKLRVNAFVLEHHQEHFINLLDRIMNNELSPLRTSVS